MNMMNEMKKKYSFEILRSYVKIEPYKCSATVGTLVFYVPKLALK